jgi:mannose-6-phosphate isomerase-like protein (cupin superfamily)
MSNDAKMQIFRAADAKGLMEEGCMEIMPSTPEQQAGMKKLMENGYHHGDEVKVLVNIPGFSLTHVWFKAGYPLLLHSHNVDCLYYIIAGSLQMGAETLGPRDSFFVPADGAYTYTPGPEGVELLEFRQAGKFDFKNLTKGAAFFEKAAKTAAASQEAWKQAKMPTLNA